MVTRRKKFALPVAAAPSAPGGGSGGQPPPPERPPEAFVVVMHSVEPEPLGRRYGIPSCGTLDVGAVGCEVLLTGDTDVAPKHVTFEWRDSRTLSPARHRPAMTLVSTPHPATNGCPNRNRGSMATTFGAASIRNRRSYPDRVLGPSFAFHAS
jgi:hypothetical protein